MNYLCIHGHFYQPPRDDPFSGVIPRDPAAVPYHDWNARVHAECYEPNAHAGNFGRISFNVGPTLLTWLEAQAPLTCQRIIAADRSNAARYGVGNALAQPYSHTILPLASRRDKELQVAWGITDFVHRFGRYPRGMWLPETAVDYETLDVLAQRSIHFTVLAPWQAAVPDLDVTQPYRVPLPSGRTMTVFFYQSELSGSISFDPGTTSNADVFVSQALLPCLSARRSDLGQDQLLLVASDGELYGHHQPWRDRFLSHLLNSSAAAKGLEVTYLSRYLRNRPPQGDIAIIEGTSWSCHHGLARWRGDCDCVPADGSWKGHLRCALDRLAAAVDGIYFDEMRHLVTSPGLTLEQYGGVLVGLWRVEEFVRRQAKTMLSMAQETRARDLLQAAYFRQRMYMSCAFFHDDLSRPEPRQSIASAARAIDLIRQATLIDLEPDLLSELRYARSARTGQTGEDIYWKVVGERRGLYEAVLAPMPA